MLFQRSSGILLHPTCLPGPHGIGTLGACAHEWLDFLSAAGQRLWQVCPIGPTGFGNSPYQCFSAFAGNPLLIDLDRLVERGLLASDDLEVGEPWDTRRVDFGRVIAFVWSRLRRAHAAFRQRASDEERRAYQRFCEQQSFWLEDYALFMAIKDSRSGQSWDGWPEPLRLRQPAALDEARRELADGIDAHRFAQHLFFEQWLTLKDAAKRRGIQIVGDIPIYVASDSAEAWSRRELFLVDGNGRPALVAGVPPDYFSTTGQLWGNPIYDWAHHQRTGYAWWLQNVQAKLELFDFFRVDHFRGFAGYWAVPYGETTAVNGQWYPGPGASLFSAIEEKLGKVPLIAEDLGVITPDVEELRDRFGFPGMKVLQFAFEATSKDEYRPHSYPLNSVAYTGTHDNDTVLAWHARAAAHERGYAEAYLRSDGREIAWDFIRAAWASTSVMALAPLQDVLSLGSESRMNTPSTTGGNWEWRVERGQLTEAPAARLRHLSGLYCRSGDLLKQRADGPV